MKETLRNITAFFRWIADFYRTWFLPYHYDGDDEEVEKAKPESVAGAADHAPDRSPKPSPPEAEVAAETATASETPPTETEPAGEASAAADPARVVQAMAFRGAVSKRALAAVLGEPPEKIADLLKPLVEAQKVNDLGGEHYVLAPSERQAALRADAKIAEWLSRFQDADMERRALDAIDRLCAELPLRLYMGKDLFFQLRHRPWMVWQSTRRGCRARLYGTLSPDQWQAVRHADRRARRFRSAGFHPYRERDCVLFLWRSDEQFSTIAAFLPEAGREFLRQTKRRRGSKPGAADEGETAEAAEAETEGAEVPEETATTSPANETFAGAEE